MTYKIKSAVVFVAIVCLSSFNLSIFALEKTRVEGDAVPLASVDSVETGVILLGEAVDSELVVGACDWIDRFINEVVKRSLPRVSTRDQKRGLYFAFGEDGARRLREASGVSFDVDPGAQGFVIRRLDGDAGFVCWSPTALGLRYAVIELIRSLRISNGVVSCPLVEVVDAPTFDYRIYYVNFASHLQNAYNVNAVYDVDYYRWNLDDWKKLLDNVSALRYNYFEFWLVPELMSPEALTDGELQTLFADTMREVVDYAKSVGVTVHPIVAVNTIGRGWHYHCPNVPEEKAEILALWKHWVKALPNVDSWGIFPGDPGGCTQNGCTKRTFVDLALEVAALVKDVNPNAKIEVGTWGDPMAGWGTPLWTGDVEIGKDAMRYFIEKLPEFPNDTFVSINIGFSPDCRPDQVGFWRPGDGDGRPFAKEAAKVVPVLTWDYSVTEGEDTVYPHCRVRRQLTARHNELETGCYSGGIAYTMAPRLQLLNQFAASEIWWNPNQTAEEILDRFGEFEFGEGGAIIGRLIEEFECVPGWGYEPAPFQYSPERLFNAMTKLLAELEVDNVGSVDSKLPFALTSAEYKSNLQFFGRLFRDLADASISLGKLRTLLRESGDAR
ncbi:MAG: hypothetical protein IK077_17240, partial [Thermoguttaceae bacterium]|nr:hypothetical protein [Thermoguttaceae bacterium]